MPDGSSDARSTILDRVRKANASVSGDHRAADYDAIPREYQRVASADRAEILKMFAERLREYDARVREAASLTAIPDEIRAALAEYGQRSALVADGFPREWLPDGLSWGAEADADIAAMDRAEGTIVACEVAIAHTGTIVLRDARRLTLLPDRLLCVVRKEQVVETVPEAFARLQAFAADALTFVSGPSATADIEMTRIRGVHGPRFLDVVLV